MNERYFTPTQVGKFIGVHHNTISRWIKKGQLKATTTLGGHRRIWYKDLMVFLKENGMDIPYKLVEHDLTE